MRVPLVALTIFPWRRLAFRRSMGPMEKWQIISKFRIWPISRACIVVSRFLTLPTLTNPFVGTLYVCFDHYKSRRSFAKTGLSRRREYEAHPPTNSTPAKGSYCSPLSASSPVGQIGVSPIGVVQLLGFVEQILLHSGVKVAVPLQPFMGKLICHGLMRKPGLYAESLSRGS